MAQQMMGWFPGDPPRPQAWDGSFHVASCLDQAPVVRGSKLKKNRTPQFSAPDASVVGFRGLQQRSLDQRSHSVPPACARHRNVLTSALLLAALRALLASED